MFKKPDSDHPRTYVRIIRKSYVQERLNPIPVLEVRSSLCALVAAGREKENYGRFGTHSQLET